MYPKSESISKQGDDSRLNHFKDKKDNAIHTTPKDQLHVSIRPITRSRAKKVKKTFNELIQDILVLFPTRLIDSSFFPYLHVD